MRLIVDCKPVAAEFLRHLNYYRFSGYGLAFQDGDRKYYNGTTFEQIKAAYEFDRKLRDYIYESMEVIELDLRTTVAYVFGQRYGSFGHANPANFHQGFQHKS